MSSPKLSIFDRGIRYFGAVVVGFAFDVLVFWLLVQSGAGILVANVCGFLIGSTVNVAMIRLLAFPGTQVPGLWDFGITFAMNVVVMLIGTLIIWTLAERFGLNLLIAKLVSNFFTLLINFTFRNLLDRYWTCFQSSQKER
ncbi:GtrA family protein [uncultured Roseobacter sp.]|uniref:GtrA family protein n=1 Tax=uncultured Roseobacter sp. TaxID=114847 RepID=UPI00261EB6FF|nr:GtrA family protein [uncultured Roseobacter sp.]